MADSKNTKSDRTWATVTEGVETDSGQWASWRVVSATEGGKVVEYYGEVQTRKGRCFVSETLLLRVLATMEQEFHKLHPGNEKKA